jgi:hypothetical protein
VVKHILFVVFRAYSAILDTSTWQLSNVFGLRAAAPGNIIANEDVDILLRRKPGAIEDATALLVCSSSPSLSLERTDAATGDSFSTDGLSKKDTTSATIAVFHNTDGLFVRGLHHAGTTLLFKLFALHPDVSPISSGKYFLSSEMLHQQLFQ